MPFIQAAGSEGISNRRHGNWSGAADTHVLVRADQEAVMNVSLHQAGLPHTLLSQHHHFGIHTHRTHSKLGLDEPRTRQREQDGDRWGGDGCQFTGLLSVLSDEKTGFTTDEVITTIFSLWGTETIINALKTMTNVGFWRLIIQLNSAITKYYFSGIPYKSFYFLLSPPPSVSADDWCISTLQRLMFHNNNTECSETKPNCNSHNLVSTSKL